MNICICGGGNLGHVVTGYLAAKRKYVVSLLTRHPERWNQTLQIHTPEGKTLEGAIDRISASPAELIPDADLVLLCLPGYAIASMLQAIRPYLKPQVAVGSVVSSTGFFFEAMAILPASTILFGFQRVPFIARIGEYGRSAHLLGRKPSLSMATFSIPFGGVKRGKWLDATISEMFDTPVTLLDSYYEVSLTNSNPLLHPSRLYSLWKDWHEGIVYPRVPLFYEEWTDEAAQLYIDMDCELQALLSQLSVTPGAIPTVLDYYESTDAPSLARKLRSIEAFKGIKAPMKAVEGGFVPDFQNRYFTEDFPYGLAIIHRLLHEHHIECPHIDQVMEWGSNVVFA